MQDILEIFSYLQPARKPISINIPDGYKLRPTHTFNLEISDIPEKAKRSHIVPGLAHASLISTSVLYNTRCKVQYDENMCGAYYNKNLVLKGGRETQTG